jgi:hypothetical protein
MMIRNLVALAFVLMTTAPARAQTPAADARTAAPEIWTGPAETAAPANLKWSGKVATELHYRVQEKVTGAWYDRQVLPKHFARNENKLNLRLQAGVDRFAAVADVDFDWLGIMESPAALADLTGYQQVSPYRLQAHALYLEITDVGAQGLDLRVGQQIIQWGVGDQFNPTNNLNASDLENILFYGRQLANDMIRLDYSFAESFSLSGVVVPVFKPAVLPASAPLAITAVDRTPFVEEELRYRVEVDRALGQRLGGYPTMVKRATAQLPAATVENMQWELRAAGTLLNQDVALSYYNGRADIPVAVRNQVSQEVGRLCDPANPRDCADGLLTNDVTLKYPKMQVIGLNMVGEANPLGFISPAFKPIGYRIEVGVYLPREQHFVVLQDQISLLGVTRNGEYDYKLANGGRPTALASTPFAKWVVGLDYSFSRHVYANAMWVHGLSDELGAGDFMSEGWSVRQAYVPSDVSESTLVNCFGAGDGKPCTVEKLRHRLGDYAVVGVDFKFDEERGLFRLFTIWDLGGIYVSQWNEPAQARAQTHYNFWTGVGFSAVVFPELDYNFGGGVTLALGALLQLGKPYTKFGDPAGGGSLVWTRATYAY